MLAASFSLSKHTCLEKKRAAPVRGAGTEISPWHQTRQGQGWELLPGRSQAAPGAGSQLQQCQDPFPLGCVKIKNPPVKIRLLWFLLSLSSSGIKIQNNSCV